LEFPLLKHTNASGTDATFLLSSRQFYHGLTFMAPPITGDEVPRPVAPLTFKPLGPNIMERNAVILGCAPSAGLYQEDISEETVVELLHEAARCNILRFDTAPLYGCGRSELDIGRAFAQDEDLMDGVQITTKVGRLCLPEHGDEVQRLDADETSKWRVERDARYYSRKRATGHLVCVADYTAEGLVRSLEQSRQRLGAAGSSTTAVALATLRIHDVESEEKFAQLEKGGMVEALVKMRDSGAIRSFGLGMNNPTFIMRLLHKYPKTFDSVLMAGAWNLIDFSGREVLAECERQGVAVHVAGVFGAGLLWGANHYKYGPATEHHKDLRDRLAHLCTAYGIPLPWLAMHFATRPECVSRLVIGCRDKNELDQCLAVLDMYVDEGAVEQLYAAIEAENLIPSEAFRSTPRII
jgi:D-threo-aldose 1-dehydrogenase